MSGSSEELERTVAAKTHWEQCYPVGGWGGGGWGRCQRVLV